jgi:hypothetical protein
VLCKRFTRSSIRRRPWDKCELDKPTPVRVLPSGLGEDREDPVGVGGEVLVSDILELMPIGVEGFCARQDKGHLFYTRYRRLVLWVRLDATSCWEHGSGILSSM